ncbi:MAG: hypothetical protein ACPGLV_12995 [Bacteroidia bacterium]
MVLFRIILCLAIMMFGVSAQAQSPTYAYSFGFRPSTLLHLSGKPGFEIEIEGMANSKFSPFVELNWITDINKMYTFNTDYFKGYALGGGFKHYFEWQTINHKFPFKFKSKSSIYFDIGYKFGKTERGMQGTFVSNDSISYTDKYISNRTEHLIFADIGARACVGRFYTDYKLGLGLNWRLVTHNERNNLNDQFYRAVGEYFLFEFEEPRLYKLPYLRLKFAIGYNLFPVRSTFTFE